MTTYAHVHLQDISIQQTNTNESCFPISNASSVQNQQNLMISFIVECRLYLHVHVLWYVPAELHVLYRISGNIGDEVNLAVW